MLLYCVTKLGQNGDHCARSTGSIRNFIAQKGLDKYTCWVILLWMFFWLNKFIVINSKNMKYSPGYLWSIATEDANPGGVGRFDSFVDESRANELSPLNNLQWTSKPMYAQPAIFRYNYQNVKYKLKACFYIVQYPVRWKTSPPGRPVHSDTNSTSLGSIQPCCNYCTNTIHSHSKTIQLLRKSIHSHFHHRL